MNGMIRSVLFSMLIATSIVAHGQNTVGLLSYDDELTAEGYTLIYPFSQPNVYLLNNCGEVVHQWNDDPQFTPGNSAYLLENSNLLKTKKARLDTSATLSSGGEGGTVEIRNWDNDLLWSYTLNNDSMRLHHDIEAMPNGNILMVAWELKTREEAIALGRDSNSVDQTLWPDVVFEVDPDLDSIVWIWRAWDHLVQDRDSSLTNFGVVSAHPELINVNFDDNRDPDWMHINAIDYHQGLDQIMLCVSFFNEIWIIDHSTTTEEARGHQGGPSNKGGDLLYRWGNPQSYGNGVPEDQLLFFPHNAHWIGALLDDTHPEFDKMAVFNNRIGINFSAANVLNPPWNPANQRYDMTGVTWGPSTYAKTITHPNPSSLFSNGLSSVQFLGNKNLLLTSGRQGYLVELTPENQVVWEYRIPLKNGIPVTQGDTVRNNENLIFHSTKYPLTYPAFVRKPIGSRVWLELNPDTLVCMLTTSTEDATPSNIQIYPNPSSDFFTLKIDARNKRHIVFSSQGKIMIEGWTDENGHATIRTEHWPSGVYFVQTEDHQSAKIIVP